MFYAVLMDLIIPDLLDKAITFVDLPEPNLRVEIFDPPNPEHNYVIGFDSAYGIIGRDSDAACILDKDTFPVEQVAEIEGFCGEKFANVIYSAAIYYNRAFVVGERQVGLPVLRRLIDTPEHGGFGYNFVYFDRSENARHRRLSDKLGHARVADDITLRNLRLAVAQDHIDVKSELLWEQMRRVEFREPRTNADERVIDEALKIKLAGGGSPDLAMALTYAWLGIGEVSKFVKPIEEQQVITDRYLGITSTSTGPGWVKRKHSNARPL